MQKSNLVSLSFEKIIHEYVAEILSVTNSLCESVQVHPEVKPVIKHSHVNTIEE